MKIAIQGTHGSFHEAAAEAWFSGEPIELVYCESFAEVFTVLEEKRADKAVVAIENSVYGAINDTFDLLRRHRFEIVGELYFHVHQQLITLPRVTLEDITHVYSQPPALVQVSRFLKKFLPHAKIVEYHDTAAAVKMVKEVGNPHYAAVASTAAADKFGLQVLRNNIENDPQNFTRFVIIDPSGGPLADADKSTLVLNTDHTPGALHRALGIWAQRGIDMTSLHSRPITNTPWRYEFFIDVAAAGEKLTHAIADLEKQDATVTVLGEYKRATHTHTS